MPANELFLTTLYNDPNLQGYYRFEGNFNDSSPNGYNAIGQNSPTFGAGQFGNALQLASASSQYAQRTSGNFANLIVSGSQTWMFWVNLTTNVAAMEGFSIYGGTTGLIRIQFNSGLNGKAGFQLLGLTTNNLVETATGVVTTGAWHHIAGVYDSAAGKLRIYVDASVTEVVAGGTVTAPTGANFDIGRLGSSNIEYLNGAIDDFAMFNRALSGTEISDYFNGNTPLRPLTTSFFHFM